MDSAIKIPQSDASGIRAFLESKFVPGVGEVYAQKISDYLGEKILQPLSLSIGDFRSIPGLGEKAAEKILAALQNLPYNAEFLSFLFSTGLSYQDISKILERYHTHAESVVLSNPYDMVEDVWKFSFFRADKIGRRLGIASEDPRRLRGALLTGVKLHAEKGSLFAGREELLATVSQITGASHELLIPQIEILKEEGRLVESLGGLYLPVYLKAEVETAEKLANILKDKDHRLEVEFELPEHDMEGHTFTEEQREAIRMVRDNPITIITGDPGTGKTTTVRGLIKLFEDEGKKVMLTAPTGRSTKKLEMTAGASAKTIHRLLGFNRGKGYRNKNFNVDVLIVDEASLLEQVLFNHLLQALPPKIKIVLVGDVGQLPPIGAGRVLEDLIESDAIPVARLTHNFRQAEGSDMSEKIREIKNGVMPEEGKEGDFMFISEEDPLKTQDMLIDLVTNRLPKKYGVNPHDIQVVSPQIDGPLGTKDLNTLLQQKLQQDAPEISRGFKKFRLGDRVVQSINSSKRGVYNGETGWISDMNPDTGYFTVTFNDGKTSLYSAQDMGELSLAYATSVHKLQGTETDYLVMPLTMDHARTLHRNLLFTAVSRARKSCVLVGDPAALKKALDTPAPLMRNSNLKPRLVKSLN